MKRPPTGFELLKVIYEHHRKNLTTPRSAEPTRAFVPIDIPAISVGLGSDPDTVFGRLYHHLDRVCGEETHPGQPRKSLFAAKLGSEANCINFPLLEAVVAGLWQERNRQLLSVWVSALSTGIALRHGLSKLQSANARRSFF